MLDGIGRATRQVLSAAVGQFLGCAGAMGLGFGGLYRCFGWALRCVNRVFGREQVQGSLVHWNGFGS